MIHKSSSQSNKQQKTYNEDDTIDLSAQCYILLEKYKLRTNLVGVNLQKDQIQQAFILLEERIIDRYSKIYEKLKDGLNKLQTQFALAQGNALRTLNNIIRNYRRRVGTLSNEPLNNLKYNRFEKQEKVLLQTLIYSQRENYPQIQAFKIDLQKNIEGALKQIQDKYHKNSKIREDPAHLFDVIDKSQCYTYKYYQNFQRSMITTINTLQGNFQKLDAFLSVWENVGSTKAYEVKSIKQIESQQKSHQVQRNRRYYEQETEQQLEQMMKNCPQNSPQRQQYRKRLNQLRRYNSEKQKKLDMVGKMYSKRRNRAGILVNKNKDISVLQWVINSQNNKVPYNYVDQFKNYKADNEHSEYRLTVYQSQKPMKNADQIKQHIQRYSNQNMSFEWWYDRFGKDGNFDLITTQSQMVQKRLQFQVIRQIQLQNNDDRRKRQQLQKHNYEIKENERKQNLHIGYLHVHDKTELQSLIGRKYNTQYIPGPIKGRLQDDIYFSDDEPQQEQIQDDEEQSFMQKPVEKSAVSFIHIEINPQKKAQQAQKKIQMPIQIIRQVQIENNQQQLTNDTLEQKIVKVYFKQYSKKMLRKQSQPQYRKTHFFYFRTIKEINWPLIGKNIDCQKIFIYTEKVIIFTNKVVSIRQQKIKCNIYSIDEDNQQQQQILQKLLTKQLKQCFQQYSLVTIKFHPVYLENDNATEFMIGLLSVLLREGKMPEDYERRDYLSEGKEIIEDFNQYFYPEENSVKNQYLRKFKPIHSKDTYNYSEKSTLLNDTSSNHSGSVTVSINNPKSQSITTKKQAIEKVSQPLPIVQPKPQQKVIKTKREDQKGLKRSNSRQFLNRYEPQIQLNSYAGEYVAAHKNIQQDYQQL